MVFLFLVDIITSAAIRITVNVGTWIVCKSMNGLYYAYKAVKKTDENVPVIAPVVTTGAHPPSGVTIASCAGVLNSESEYVVITRDEYDRLCGRGTDYATQNEVETVR
jgi:hypothetical protein